MIIIFDSYWETQGEELFSALEAETVPLAAYVQSRGEEERGPVDMSIDWVNHDDLQELPSKIRDASERSLSWVCHGCGRNVAPVGGGAWCPFCGAKSTAESDKNLAICQPCPNDVTGGTVYHHSYRHCPRCGAELRRLRGLEWWEYRGDEHRFLDGMSLDEIEIDAKHMP